MPRNVKKNIFAEPRHQVVAARGGSFKTLLQRPREKNGCSKGGGLDNNNGLIVIGP